jgi:hypothetical protein
MRCGAGSIRGTVKCLTKRLDAPPEVYPEVSEVGRRLVKSGHLPELGRMASRGTGVRTTLATTLAGRPELEGRKLSWQVCVVLVRRSPRMRWLAELRLTPRPRDSSTLWGGILRSISARADRGRRSRSWLNTGCVELHQERSGPEVRVGRAEHLIRRIAGRRFEVFSGCLTKCPGAVPQIRHFVGRPTSVSLRTGPKPLRSIA